MYLKEKFDIVGKDIPTKKRPINPASHPNIGFFINDIILVDEFLTLYPQLGHFFAVSDI